MLAFLPPLTHIKSSYSLLISILVANLPTSQPKPPCPELPKWIFLRCINHITSWLQQPGGRATGLPQSGPSLSFHPHLFPQLSNHTELLTISEVHWVIQDPLPLVILFSLDCPSPWFTQQRSTYSFHSELTNGSCCGISGPSSCSIEQTAFSFMPPPPCRRNDAQHLQQSLSGSRCSLKLRHCNFKSHSKSFAWFPPSTILVLPEASAVPYLSC